MTSGPDNPHQIEFAHESGFLGRRFGAGESRNGEMNRCELIKLICPTSGQISRFAVDWPAACDLTPLRHHLNCGTVGTLICGGGSGATFWAFAIPLGSIT